MCRGCERASWEGLWKGIIRRRWEGFKFYEIVVKVDERLDCFYKRLHEAGDIVSELVNVAITHL